MCVMWTDVTVLSASGYPSHLSHLSELFRDLSEPSQRACQGSLLKHLDFPMGIYLICLEISAADHHQGGIQAIYPVHPICPTCSVTNLDNKYASEGKAPSRLQPPSSRQVRNATSGAGSGPDGMGSSSGAVMVKPVPVLRGGGGERYSCHAWP